MHSRSLLVHRNGTCRLHRLAAQLCVVFVLYTASTIPHVSLRSFVRVQGFGVSHLGIIGGGYIAIAIAIAAAAVVPSKLSSKSKRPLG